MKPRIITPEILDGLPDADPSAQRSRRDLHRIHRAMRTRTLIMDSLRTTKISNHRSPKLRILEIGAGDGDLLLAVARRMRTYWPKVELTLLDRLDLVERSTLAAYAALGWTATSLVMDVLEWAGTEPDATSHADATRQWDLIVANLFLHHFDDAQLRALLGAIAARTHCFLALEPRRAWLAKVASRLVGAIGANSVTRTDAVLSVDAGFRDCEITALWPGDASQWRQTENAVGLFSHRFLAECMSITPPGDSRAVLV